MGRLLFALSYSSLFKLFKHYHIQVFTELLKWEQVNQIEQTGLPLAAYVLTTNVQSKFWNGEAIQLTCVSGVVKSEFVFETAAWRKGLFAVTEYCRLSTLLATLNLHCKFFHVCSRFILPFFTNLHYPLLTCSTKNNRS